MAQRIRVQPEELRRAALALDHPTTLLERGCDVTALELAQRAAAGLERARARTFAQPFRGADGALGDLLERAQIDIELFSIQTRNDALQRQPGGFEQLDLG